MKKQLILLGILLAFAVPVTAMECDDLEYTLSAHDGSATGDEFESLKTLLDEKGSLNLNSSTGDGVVSFDDEKIKKVAEEMECGNDGDNFSQKTVESGSDEQYDSQNADSEYLKKVKEMTAVGSGDNQTALKNQETTGNSGLDTFNRIDAEDLSSQSGSSDEIIAASENSESENLDCSSYDSDRDSENNSEGENFLQKPSVLLKKMSESDFDSDESLLPDNYYQDSDTDGEQPTTDTATKDAFPEKGKPNQNPKPIVEQSSSLSWLLSQKIFWGGGISGLFVTTLLGYHSINISQKRAHVQGKRTKLDRLFAKFQKLVKRNKHAA